MASPGCLLREKQKARGDVSVRSIKGRECSVVCWQIVNMSPSRTKKKVMLCSICSFLWCKYHDGFQAANNEFANTELERNVHNWLSHCCYVPKTCLDAGSESVHVEAPSCFVKTKDVYLVD